jgi:AcrR family transcriptional regulator
MPKIVDHDERRRELAHAVWRVVQRDGVDRASIRRVAEEAGWSAGALRHYFATQSDLLAFAMRSVVERIEERLVALERPADPRESVEKVLHEVLPLDDDRRVENEVWLAFTARALVDRALRAQYAELHDALHQACRSVVEELTGTTRGSRPAKLETERLHALIDGLAVDSALRPDIMTPKHIAAVLRSHLDDVAQRGRPR